MSVHADDRDERTRILGLVALLAVLPPLFTVVPLLPDVIGSGYYSRLFNDVIVFALFAVALNVVFGHTDQLFLFLGGLAGVGAYSTALLADTLGVTAWATLAIGALLAGAIGMLVSWVAAKREYNVILISILTLNLQLALSELFIGARDLTGGSTGRPFTGLDLDVVGDLVGVSAEVVLYYVLLVVLLGVLLGYLRLVDSRYGLAFDTIREDSVAAASIGVDVVRYKTISGFLAATLVGLVGVLYAQGQRFILPPQFSFATIDVIVLIMLIVGGLRSTLGPVIGAIIVVILREGLQRTVGEWETAIFGALLIVLFLYFRSGVVPAVLDRLGERGPEGGGGGAPTAEPPGD